MSGFKKPYVPAKGVSNIELFYDLIFVYCISLVTGVMHEPAGGFFNVETYALYAVDLLTILQVWFFTTFLQNRYGDGSAFDNVCLFINMFLLYFMAGCVGDGWQSNMLTWNLAWSFLIIDILVHWAIKRARYTNLSDEDKAVMNRTIAVLAVQAAMVLASAFLPWEAGQWVSLAAFAFGWLAFAQGGRLAARPTRFAHLAERCALLVIVTFGEAVVGLAGYIGAGADPVMAALAFLLVVGLFLVYFHGHDRLLDHHAETGGIAYMLLTALAVFAVSNMTVALEYLPEHEVARVPEGVFLVAAFALYLAATLAIARWYKPEHRRYAAFAAARAVAVAVVACTVLLSGADSVATLGATTAATYALLLFEWAICRKDAGRMTTNKTIETEGGAA